MFDSRIVSLAILLSASTLTFAGDDAETKDLAADVTEQWQADGWPLVQKYCLDCHNKETQEAELDLSEFAAIEALDGGAGSMQRLMEIVRFGAMPPEDAEQPSPKERKTLVRSLDRTLFAVSCDLRPRPGKVTARRLNRAEYNHSIRDLFGIELSPADAFPSDEVGAGFDNNGDVLSLSPMLMEKYFTAAEEVASIVLIDPSTLPKVHEGRASDQLLVHGDSKTGSFNGRFLAKDAFIWAEFEIPVQGEYRIRVQGGNALESATEPTTAALYDKDGLLRGSGGLKFYDGGGGGSSFEFRTELSPGKHRFFVEPYHGDEPLKVGETRSKRFAELDPATIKAGVERAKMPLVVSRRFDREAYPFMVRRIGVDGPTQQPPGTFPPSQKQILRRVAKYRNERWHEVEQAAIECLRPLMRRAFREPVSVEEVKPYAKLVSISTQRGESYYRGLQVAITAVLMSPRFLFRVETPPQDWKREEDGSVRLTQIQLATRLSYFLWSSLPDERLLADAEKGKLDDKTLEQHIRRMLKDEKASSLAQQFAAQWLGLRNLDNHEADTDRFQAFTPSLRKAMRRETELLFMHVVENNLPVTDLLSCDYTFVNEELAKHYELSDVEGPEFQKVSLQGTPRRGVLSHASVLTLTSNSTRTSPVKRGKWILENILGTPPPEPPSGVPELEEAKIAAATATLREQMEIHRTDPTCAACHRVMDVLGFGLEQYDAIGRFRKKEGDLLIDASGELPGGRTFNGAAELSELLGRTESEAFAHTVVHRLMTFALGRELMPADRCVIDEIDIKTSKQDYRFTNLVLEVVKSRPFQYYEWDEPTE